MLVAFAFSSFRIGLVRSFRVWEGTGMALVLNSTCDINEEWGQVTTFLGLSPPFFFAAKLSTSGCTCPCLEGWSG